MSSSSTSRIYNRALEQDEVAAYVTAVRAGGAARERALAVPNVLAPRRVLAARAAYRLSDHAIQFYGDLSALKAGAAGAAQTSVKEPMDNVFAGEARISVKDPAGREVAGETLRGCRTTGLLHRSYPLAADLPEGTYRAEIAAGGLRAETRFTRVREEWENNRIGLTDKVIPPWTPMTQGGNRATCWGRQYTFGGLGLPAQIRSCQPEPTWGAATKDLLAAPVELVVETPGGRLAWQSGTPRLRQLGAAGVAVEGRSQTAGGELTARVRGQLEFDGFYKFTLWLVPARQLEVASVRLEVPLPDSLARLFNMSSIGNMRANKAFLDLDGQGDGELWNSLNRGTNKDLNFAPHAWLGDDDRGIAFMGDSNRGWIVEPGKPCMDLVRREGQTRLRLLLVNTAAKLQEPIQTTLSLEATPIRPRPPGGSWKKAPNGGWSYFDAPALYDGCFDPARATRAEDHPGEKGKPWWRYFCFRSLRIAPGDSHFPTVARNEDEWWGDWGPGLHVPSDNDYQLWIYKQWHDKLGMTGIYYDNTFANATSLLGSGLAWQDAAGRIHPSSCTFGDREFLKRVRTYFLQQGPPPVLNVHMTDAPIVGALGFSDLWMDGENGGYLTQAEEEEVAKGRPKDFVDRWAMPAGMTNLRITMGRMWGSLPIYLYTWGAEETQTILGLFDNPHGKRVTLGGVPRNDIDLTAEDLRFHGFWNPDGRWEVLRGGRIFVSAWSRPNPARLRLMIANVNNGPAEVDLRVDPARFGLSGPVEASDEVDGSLLPMRDGVIRRIAVRRHANRCLLLAAPGVFDSGPARDIARLNTGKRIAELCDDFSTLGPAWEPSFNPRPAYGPKENRPTFEPFFGALRIHTNGGFANVARPLGRDGISLRVRMYSPTGRQCGNPDQTHPMAALYWGRGRYIKCVMTNPWNNDGTKNEMFFRACQAGRRQTMPCPKPLRVAWARFDLAPAASISTFRPTCGSGRRSPACRAARRRGKASPVRPPTSSWASARTPAIKTAFEATPRESTTSWSYYDELVVEELPVRPHRARPSN